MFKRFLIFTLLVVAHCLFWPSMKAVNYYKILGVDQNASVADIKRAYLKLAKQWHLDKKHSGKNPDPDYIEAIADAYVNLSDASTRSSYDMTLNSNSDNNNVNTQTSSPSTNSSNNNTSSAFSESSNEQASSQSKAEALAEYVNEVLTIDNVLRHKIDNGIAMDDLIKECTLYGNRLDMNATNLKKLGYSTAELDNAVAARKQKDAQQWYGHATVSIRSKTDALNAYVKACKEMHYQETLNTIKQAAARGERDADRAKRAGKAYGAWYKQYTENVLDQLATVAKTYGCSTAELDDAENKALQKIGTKTTDK